MFFYYAILFVLTCIGILCIRSVFGYFHDPSFGSAFLTLFYGGIVIGLAWLCEEARTALEIRAKMEHEKKRNNDFVDISE